MRHLVGSPRNFAACDLPLICFKVVPFLYYSRETTFPREYRGFAPLLGEKKGNRPRWEENGDRKAEWRAREVGNIAVENGNMRREKSFESRHSLKQAVSRELTRKKGKKCDERVGQKRANRKLYPGQYGLFPCAILLFSLARWGCQAWSLLVATGDPRLAATRQTLLISLFPCRGLRLFVGAAICSFCGSTPAVPTRLEGNRDRQISLIDSTNYAPPSWCTRQGPDGISFLARDFFIVGIGNSWFFRNLQRQRRKRLK